MKKFFVIAGALALLLGAAYYFVYPAFEVIEVNDLPPQSFEAPAEKSKTVANGAHETGPIEYGPYAVIGTTAHPAKGEVKIFNDGGKLTVRYENLETINGPDLYVYVSKDQNAKDFIDLGPIKGTKGNINYEVPPGVKLDDYRYVLIWCRPFGVLFNYAEIK